MHRSSISDLRHRSYYKYIDCLLITVNKIGIVQLQQGLIHKRFTHVSIEKKIIKIVCGKEFPMLISGMHGAVIYLSVKYVK